MNQCTPKSLICTLWESTCVESPSNWGQEGDLRDPEVPADPGLCVKIGAGGGADTEGRRDGEKRTQADAE